MSDDCLFCKIVKGDIPGDKVYEDDTIIAFRDINPQAPNHVLVIPRQHIASLNDAGEPEAELLGQLLLTARKIAADLGMESGYRVVNNCGASAGHNMRIRRNRP